MSSVFGGCKKSSSPNHVVAVEHAVVLNKCPAHFSVFVLLAGAVQHEVPAKLQQRDEPRRHCEHQRVGRRSVSAVRYGSRLQVRGTFCVVQVSFVCALFREISAGSKVVLFEAGNPSLCTNPAGLSSRSSIAVVRPFVRSFNRTVSTRHASVRFQGGRFYFSDLMSSNGSYL